MSKKQEPLRRRRPSKPKREPEAEEPETVGGEVPEVATGSGPKYLLSFSESASEKVVQYILTQLKGKGLLCDLTWEGASRRYVLVSAAFEVLSKQAEMEHWTKQLCNSEEMVEFCAESISEFELMKDGKMFASAEELQLLRHTIDSTPYKREVFKELEYSVPGGKGFLGALLGSEPSIIGEEFPLHDPRQIADLSGMLKQSFIPLRGIDVDKIRNYFGEDVAFYFAWMNFYSTCVLVPAVVGVVMYFARGAGTTVDTDPYLPFYSVFMAFWAVLFLVFWQRRSAVHSFHWNTHSYCSLDEISHKFHGVLVKDPVTEEPVLYYPAWKRRLWYLFSVLAMLPLLSGGVGVMVLSLNLNGYVGDKSSPIYVAWLAQYAEPGRIFAGDSPYYLWLVPTLAHSVVVSTVNQLYSGVASKCTDLENHRTFREWHSALVMKRVFFECFDCFMPLFYIAFYQLDVVTLRAEISALFMSDEIRRVTVECVIPLVMGSFLKKSSGSGSYKHADLFLAEYDQFDDYLEMVVQFGYITLFAAAFPLGGMVTVIFIYVELRSDIFKLLHAYRRPVPLKCKHIGVWYEVMLAMVFLAILTNCAILGFSSEQLMQWVPSLFTREAGGGDQVMASGSGRYVVGLVFGFEHLVLVAAVLLQWSIHPVPKWVRVAVQRREHLAWKRGSRSREEGQGHHHAPGEEGHGHGHVHVSH